MEKTRYSRGITRTTNEQNSFWSGRGAPSGRGRGTDKYIDKMGMVRKNQDGSSIFIKLEEKEILEICKRVKKFTVEDLFAVAYIDTDSLGLISFILQHVDINERDSDGRTVLFYSVASKFDKSAQTLYLLERGADPNATDKLGRTPIFYAEHEISMLIDHGAFVDVTDNLGATPLHSLFLTNDEDNTIVGNERKIARRNCTYKELEKNITLFLRAGADINTEIESSGESILHTLIFEPKYPNDLQREKRLVTFLIEHGLDINKVTHKHCTPLHFAAFAQNQIIDTLLENGADQEILNDYGEKALDIAIARSWNYGIEKLKPKVDEDWNNPLHLAIMEENYQKTMEILSTKPKFFDDINRKLQTPLVLALNMAAKSRRPEADLSSYTGDMVKIALELINMGAKIKSSDGSNIMHLAVMISSSPLLTALLERGIDQEDIDSSLLLAIKNKKWALSKFLVERGANVNAKDSDGISPMHYVFSVENYDWILFNALHSAGANINAKDKWGNSVLHWMFRSGVSAKMIKMVVRAGGKLDAVNNNDMMTFEM